MNLNNILNGWQNFIFKSEVTEAMKNERGAHCVGCEYKHFSKTLQAFVKDDLIEVEGFVCDKCHCPLSAKLLSINENCPIGLW